MGLRVWEGGESECLPVMGRIEVESRCFDREQEPTDNIASRASGQTSTWSLITREFGEPLQQGRQMTAVATLAGAPCYEVEPDQLEEGQPRRKAAPSAYREGGKG